jgi:hypothetical protein
VSAVPKFIAKAVDVNPWSKQSGMLLTISGLGSTEDHNRRAKQSLLWTFLSKKSAFLLTTALKREYFLRKLAITSLGLKDFYIEHRMSTTRILGVVNYRLINVHVLFNMQRICHLSL